MKIYIYTLLEGNEKKEEDWLEEGWEEDDSLEASSLVLFNACSSAALAIPAFCQYNLAFSPLRT